MEVRSNRGVEIDMQFISLAKKPYLFKKQTKIKIREKEMVKSVVTVNVLKRPMKKICSVVL